MALIVRDELNLECRVAGRLVEEEAKKATEPLEDAALDRIFKPVLDFVEERTECKVTRRIEEDRAQRQDDEEEEEKEDIKRKRIASVTEKMVVRVVRAEREPPSDDEVWEEDEWEGDERVLMYPHDFDRIKANAPNAIVRAVQEAPEHPEAMMSSNDSDILDGDSGDEEFDRYRKKARIEVVDRFAPMVGEGGWDIPKRIQAAPEIRGLADAIAFLEAIKDSAILGGCGAYTINSHLRVLRAIQAKAE